MSLSQNKNFDPGFSQKDSKNPVFPDHSPQTGLARHIRQRHDRVSGPAMRRFDRSFARRHPPAGVQRLPLLSAVLKRWGLTEDSYSGRPTAAAHVRRTGGADFSAGSSPTDATPFKSQANAHGSVVQKQGRPAGEKKEAPIRTQTQKPAPGAESNALQAYPGGQPANPPTGAEMIPGVIPAISAAARIPAADPPPKGMINRPGREYPGNGQFSNSKSSRISGLPVAVTPSPGAGRTEAPILQRRIKTAARQDLKIAAATQTQEQPPGNRPAGTRLKSVSGTAAKTAPPAGNLRQASDNHGAAVIQRIQDQPGINGKLPAAGPEPMPDMRPSNRRPEYSRPVATFKGVDAAAVQKKAAENTDDARVALPPQTARTTLDGLPQGNNHSAGQHAMAPVKALDSARPNSPANVSGAGGWRAPSSDAVIGVAMDPAIDITRIENVKISATDHHSIHHAAMPSSVPVVPAPPKTAALVENRTLPQMMIHRNVTSAGHAGFAGADSTAAEETRNTGARRAVDRPLIISGGRADGFDAMSMAAPADRMVPLTAKDQARRPLVQLTAAALPESAAGRSMRSSAVQIGGLPDTRNLVAEPHDGRAANDSAGSTDLEQLVDKVLHKLIRRIAVEKERRGLQRWP